MAEADWLASSNLRAMLSIVTGRSEGPRASGIISGRKLSLFVLACASIFGIDEAWGRWFEAVERAGWRKVRDHLSPEEAARYWCGEKMGQHHPVQPTRTEKAEMAGILRDIAGNPYRPLMRPHGPMEKCKKCGGKIRGVRASSGGWTTCQACKGKLLVPGPVAWPGPTALSLAQAAYENRFADETLVLDRLAVLSDALEEAGCASVSGRTKEQVIGQRRNAVMGGCCNRFADHLACECLEKASPEGLLEHLRSPGPHCRGCWAIDLLLGKS